MKKTLFALGIFICSFSFSQLKTENNQSAEFYIKNVLLGPGIQVANIKHIGMIGGFGQFEADSSIIGVKSGLVLSTGNIDSIAGPNQSHGYTSSGKWPEDNYTKRRIKRGDKDLNKICRSKTKDITTIEFDFVPVMNKLEFNYVFASEEYTEYVTSQYNDVFAFFLSGPGIRKKVNLAVLPDGKTPISINTINHKKNKQYFRRNEGGFVRIKNKFQAWYQNKFEVKPEKIAKRKNALINQIEFDGLTVVLKVQYDVIPYRRYHIKMAIGDVMDGAYDSAVFIEAGSFVSVLDTGGVHYETLVKLQSQNIDIDSILGTKDPIIPTIVEPEINKVFEVTNVYFNSGSNEIPDSSKLGLDELATYLLNNEALNCTLWGYTDNVGSKKHNQKLSEKRALEVRMYLISKGINEDRLFYEGHNFTNYKHDNGTENGRSKNRRVEIVLE